MGRLSYNSSYGSTQYTFADTRNKVTLSNLTQSADLMPSEGAPISAVYNLANVGISSDLRGTVVTVNVILYDSAGKTQTCPAKITAPTSSPSPIALTITPDGGALNWNDLRYIQLSGPSGLVTRSGSNFFYVDYATPCGPPSNVRLSATESAGPYVILSWDSGTDGDDNAIAYHEIGRKESADGITWGEMEYWGSTMHPLTLTTQEFPPETIGHYYRFYVRAVGEAGEDFASSWVECAQTLKKTKPALLSYTDPVLTAGKTRIKAVHMTQLQQNINTMRVAYGFAEYSFTAIRAGYTSLGGWLDHINEMRAAIDGMTSNHEAWIVLEENRPRAAVMEQLRRVVAAL